jgi:hypothetical protein
MHGIHPAISGEIDVVLKSADIAAAFGFQVGLGNETNCLTLTFRCSCGSRLDYIDADPVKSGGDFKFFRRGQRNARSLFPVTQGCVKKANLFRE